MRSYVRLCTAVVAINAALAASTAWACPACFTSSAPGVRLGYYISAALMSLMPLLIMGAGVGYVALKRSRAGKEAQADSELG